MNRKIQQLDDKTFRVVDDLEYPLADSLPVGVYRPKISPAGVFFIKEDDFNIPDKIYGNPEPLVEKYIKSYESSDSSMGIFFYGQKGSGKTLLAKYITYILNRPTIVITSDTDASQYRAMLNHSCMDNVIIFIDEFEKITNEASQESLLTLLNGTDDGKKQLWLLTANDNKINENFINRPGRIRYMREFTGLSIKDVEEIAKDKLRDLSLMSSLLKSTLRLQFASYDSIISIIDEMNLHDIDAFEAIKDMNVRAVQSKIQIEYKISQDFSLYSDKILYIDELIDSIKNSEFIGFTINSNRLYDKYSKKIKKEDKEKYNFVIKHFYAYSKIYIKDYDISMDSDIIMTHKKYNITIIIKIKDINNKNKRHTYI